MTQACTIYKMWIERNCRIFQSKKRNEESMVTHIIREKHGKGYQDKRIRTRLQQRNMYP